MGSGAWDAMPEHAVSGRMRATGLSLWFAVGAAYGFCLAGLLTVGAFLLPIALAGTALLFRRRSTRGGWPGVIGGPAAALFYLAYLNRSGPGNICTTIGSGQSCMQQYAPWPFLVAALVLLGATGITIAVRRNRDDMPRT